MKILTRNEKGRDKRENKSGKSEDIQNKIYLKKSTEKYIKMCKIRLQTLIVSFLSRCFVSSFIFEIPY